MLLVHQAQLRFELPSPYERLLIQIPLSSDASHSKLPFLGIPFSDT